MNQRLQQFLAAENISQAQFADTIEVARASVSHVLAGRNKPGYDFIKSITDHYPRLSLDWLINGKGKMYRQEYTATFDSPVTEPLSSSNNNTTTELEENKAVGSYDGQLFGPEELDDAPTNEESYRTTPSTNVSKTMERIGKTSVNQRNISRVIVFYDDNTYQELK